MVIQKKELEKREEKMLAPYAVKSSASRGREFAESADSTRTEFQRDRDRIIHSKPFRRLSGKTQVFVATYGDHFRDRLSHTLEVAQISRDLARNLRLNEDLCEAIALAHDLGHPPFGHAGEATLNKIMKKFGGHFEHNEQSKRIVESLEKQFPNFDGLNLTWEVRQGLAKHQTFYDQAGREISGKSLEAQVVDLADEIAYHNHDLDDGLRSKLFSLADLQKISLWRESLATVQKKYGVQYSTKLDSVVLRHRTVSHLISLMIIDVLEETAKNLRASRIKNLAEVLRQPKNLVRFSAGFQKKISELRKFLWKRMYQSPRVLKHSRRGQRILEKLFWKLYKKPKLLPRRFYGTIGKLASPLARHDSLESASPLARHDSLESDSLEVVVKDYVAGCTDRYAEKLVP